MAAWRRSMTFIRQHGPRMMMIGSLTMGAGRNFHQAFAIGQGNEMENPPKVWDSYYFISKPLCGLNGSKGRIRGIYRLKNTRLVSDGLAVSPSP
eukprot:964939-Amorphochlora_amoeboformis.AAC.1